MTAVPVELKSLRQWLWARWLWQGDYRSQAEQAANKVLNNEVYRWTVKEFPKFFTRRPGMTFSDEIQQVLAGIGHKAYVELLHGVMDSDWLKEVHRALQEGEARKQTILSLGSLLEASDKSVERLNAELAKTSDVVVGLKHEQEEALRTR